MKLIKKKERKHELLSELEKNNGILNLKNKNDIAEILERINEITGSFDAFILPPSLFMRMKVGDRKVPITFSLEEQGVYDDGFSNDELEKIGKVKSLANHLLKRNGFANLSQISLKIVLDLINRLIEEALDPEGDAPEGSDLFLKQARNILVMMLESLDFKQNKEQEQETQSIAVSSNTVH